MADVGSLVIELDVDDKKLKVKIHDAERIIKKFSRATDRMGKSSRMAHKRVTSLGGAFRDTTLTIGLARHALENFHAVTSNLVLQVAKASGEIERLTVLMTGLSKETDTALRFEDAQKNVDWLLNAAQKMPFSIKELAGGMAKLKAVGIDPLTGSFNAVAEAVARFGGDGAVFHRAVIAIQQMAGKGVISMEELRQQLGEAVPDAIKTLARGMGQTMGELVTNIGKGRVSAENLTKMFVLMQAQAGGSAARLMDTWSGQLQRLETRWMIFLSNIGNAGAEQGVFSTLKKEVENFSNYLGSPAGKYWAEQIGAMMTTVVIAVRDGTVWIIENITAIKRVLIAFAAFKGFGLIVAGIASISAAIGALSLVATPAAAVVLALTAGFVGLAAVMGDGDISDGIDLMAKKIGLLTNEGSTLSAMWNKLSDDYEGTAERINNSKGLGLLPGDKGVVERELIALQKNVGEAQEALRKAEENLAKTVVEQKGHGTRQATKLVLEAERQVFVAADGLEAQVNRLGMVQGTWMTLIQGMRETSAQDLVLSLGNEIQTEISALTGMVQQANDVYDKALEAAVAIKDPTASAEARRVATATYISSINDMYDTSVDSVTARREAFEKEIATTAEGTERYRFLELAIKAVTEIEEELYRRQVKLNVELERGVKYVDSTNTALTKLTQKFEGRFQSYANQVASLTAEMTGQGGALAKLNAELSNKNGPWEGLTDAQVKRLRDGAKAADAAKVAVKAYREELENQEEIQNKLQNLEAGQSARMARINEEYDVATGKVNVYSASMRGLLNQVAKIKAELALNGDPLDTGNADVYAALDRLISNESAGEAKKLMTELATETHKLEQNLLDLDPRAAAKNAYDREVKVWEKKMEAAIVGAENLKEVEEEYAQWLVARNEVLVRELESPMDKLRREWVDTTDEMENLWADSMEGMTDAIVEFVKTGKFNFKDLIDSVLEELLRIQIQKMVTGPLSQALELVGKAVIGSFGSSGAYAGGSGPAAGSYRAAQELATGGIFGPKGMMDLKAYANGGIATSPQLALFGEGDQNEAFVPLPDGKRIPVDLGGQQMGGGNTVVNVINQTSQAVGAETNERFDGQQMILDVVLKAANQPGGFRDGIRGAMR